jgi:hypothetical protein
MERLSARAVRVRVLATVLGGALLLAGTLWGTDDAFPFGPFSMFAGVNRLDDPAPDTRVEALDSTGRLIVLTEQNAGVRRAEIEGGIPRFQADPTLLKSVARAYADRNPGAARIVEVRVVTRWHELDQGEPTGAYRDQVVATWRA